MKHPNRNWFLLSLFFLIPPLTPIGVLMLSGWVIFWCILFLAALGAYGLKGFNVKG